MLTDEHGKDTVDFTSLGYHIMYIHVYNEIHTFLRYS